MRKKKIKKTINEMYVSALDPLLNTRAVVDGNNLTMVLVDFRNQICVTVEQALYLKFPNIKQLSVESYIDEMINVQFEEDETHTREIIEDYLEQMKAEVKTFKL